MEQACGAVRETTDFHDGVIEEFTKWFISELSGGTICSAGVRIECPELSRTNQVFDNYERVIQWFSTGSIHSLNLDQN
jgi:hypothetical protein